VAVRVLVVDDLAPFREVARAVIDATDGFETVGEAASGEEALLAVCLLRPDLVLMDVNMPGIDGLEATRRIRSRPVAPVVLLFSTWESGEGFEVASSGAAEYIAKSTFDPDRLALAWRSALMVEVPGTVRTTDRGSRPGAEATVRRQRPRAS
jgi:DNA-binding NarL/FixJ family response regulator